MLTGLLAVATVGCGVFAAYWFNTTEPKTKKAADEQTESARLVETVTARRADQRVRVRAMGSVMAAREVTITPRVTGEIVDQSDAFVPGGVFEAGEFMLQIDRTDYEQALLQRESELTQAEAALKIELGDQAVAREELELLQVDIPEINRDLILRKPQVSQARASVKAAEAALRGAEVNLDRTRITAPFDGQIISREVTVGNNVSAGDALATFVGSDRYWVELTVPVSSLRWIEFPESASGRGSRARVTYERAWGPGVSREGFVTQLVGRLETESRLARVLVSVPDPLAREPGREDKPPLILGAFVDVVIDGRILPDVVVIDRDDLREGDTVWVMNEENRLETRGVEVAYRGRDRAYIREGLRDGDRVIRTNLQTPVDGMLLRTAEGADDEGAGLASIGSAG